MFMQSLFQKAAMMNCKCEARAVTDCLDVFHAGVERLQPQVERIRIWGSQGPQNNSQQNLAT